MGVHTLGRARPRMRSAWVCAMLCAGCFCWGCFLGDGPGENGGEGVDVPGHTGERPVHHADAGGTDTPPDGGAESRDAGGGPWWEGLPDAGTGTYGPAVAEFRAPTGDVTVYVGDPVELEGRCTAEDGTPVGGETLALDGDLLDPGVSPHQVTFDTPGRFTVQLACGDSQAETARATRAITVLPQARIVFLSDQAGPSELYLTTLDAPGEHRKLSPEVTATSARAEEIFYGPGDHVLVVRGPRRMADANKRRGVWALYSAGTPRLEQLAGPDYGPLVPTPTGVVLVRDASAGQTGTDSILAYNLEGADPTLVADVQAYPSPLETGFAWPLPAPEYLLYAPPEDEDVPVLLDLATGNATRIELPGSGPWFAEFYRDGNHFAIRRDDGQPEDASPWYLGRVAAPNPLTRFDSRVPPDPFSAVIDERVLIADGRAGQLYSADLGGGDRTALLSLEPGDDIDLCGNRIVRLSWSFEVGVASAEDYLLGETLQGPTPWPDGTKRSYVAWSQDCAQAAYPTDRGGASIVQLEGPAEGGVRPHAEIPTIPPGPQLTFSPAGGYLSVCGTDHGRVYASDGSDTGAEGNCPIAFAADDSYFVRVAAVRGGARPELVPLESGRAAPPVPLSEGAIWPASATRNPSSFRLLAVSPSGERVAFSAIARPNNEAATHDHGIYEYRVENGALRKLVDASVTVDGSVERYASVPGQDLVLFSGDLLYGGEVNLFVADLAADGPGTPLLAGDGPVSDVSSWQLPAGGHGWMPLQVRPDASGSAAFTDGPPTMLLPLRRAGAFEPWSPTRRLLGWDGEHAVLYAEERAIHRRTLGSNDPPTLLWSYGKRSPAFDTVTQQREQRRMFFLWSDPEDPLYQGVDRTDQLYMLDYDGALTRVSDPQQGAVRPGFAVEQGGDRVAFTQCDGRCLLRVHRPGHPLDGPDHRFREQVGPETISELVFAPQREHFAFLQGGRLQLEHSSRPLPSVTLEESERPNRLSVSGDGRFLTMCRQLSHCDGALYPLDDPGATLELSAVTQQVELAGGTPEAFSPAHDYLLLHGTDASGRVFVLMPLDGSEPRRIALGPNAGHIRSVAFDPSGRSLLVLSSALPTAEIPARAHVLTVADDPLVPRPFGPASAPWPVSSAEWIR